MGFVARIATAVPHVIPYPQVLDAIRDIGVRCVYPNGGAFAVADAGRAQSVGWVGPDDPTIRPEARGLARRVPPPYESNLARLLVRAWREVAPTSVAWLMPASHWAYELRFGSGAWLPDVLTSIGIDHQPLESSSQANAIEFLPEEASALEHVARRLLESLAGSDFSVLLPPRAVVGRLHHHKQVWWTTSEDGVIEALRAIV